jgi:hypothetical protein
MGKKRHRAQYESVEAISEKFRNFTLALQPFFFLLLFWLSRASLFSFWVEKSSWLLLLVLLLPWPS